MFHIIHSQNVWFSTRKQTYYSIELWPQPVPQTSSSLKRQLKKGWKKGCIIYPLWVEDVRSSDLTKTARQACGWVGNLIWIFQISLWCLNHKTTLPHSYAYSFHSRDSKLQGRIFQKKPYPFEVPQNMFENLTFLQMLQWKVKSLSQFTYAMHLENQHRTVALMICCLGKTLKMTKIWKS